MESEKGKQKASTSAATSTLGMAAMLSAVSNVFSSANNDSSSQASESEDEYSQATGGNSTITNDTDNDNPWNEDNLSKSQVKSPRKRPAPLFEHYYSDGAMPMKLKSSSTRKTAESSQGQSPLWRSSTASTSTRWGSRITAISMGSESASRANWLPQLN